MPEPTAAFCISCGKPVEGDWCPEPCHTDLRDSNNRVTCRRKHGVCNCPDCCEVRRSRATDPSLSDIPLHIRIAEDVRNARSAATSYPTDTVMCSACAGTGEYDWNEIDIYSKCATCAGRGEIEVCAQCHDSGDECGACGV